MTEYEILKKEKKEKRRKMKELNRLERNEKALNRQLIRDSSKFNIRIGGDYLRANTEKIVKLEEDEIKEQALLEKEVEESILNEEFEEKPALQVIVEDKVKKLGIKIDELETVVEEMEKNNLDKKEVE